MKIINKSYLISAILIIFSGLILSALYRPYIYSNNINDFGFADTIGSLIAVVAFCFFVWGFKEYSNQEKNRRIFNKIIYEKRTHFKIIKSTCVSFPEVRPFKIRL